MPVLTKYSTLAAALVAGLICLGLACAAVHGANLPDDIGPNLALGETFKSSNEQDRAESRLFSFEPVLSRHVRLACEAGHDNKPRFDPAYCFTTEVEVYAQPRG